jgi:hypothetical protein
VAAKGQLRPKSKAQARLFGAVAGGKRTRLRTGLSKAQARKALRGVRLKDLPARKRQK